MNRRSFLKVMTGGFVAFIFGSLLGGFNRPQASNSKTQSGFGSGGYGK